MFGVPLRCSLLYFALLASGEKISQKFSLGAFREDFKSVEETCQAVGYVKRNCQNVSATHIIAFHVQLKNDVGNLGNNAKVVFETVVLNEGNGYDAKSGIFTTPTSGIYVFDWTAAAPGARHAYTALRVNGIGKAWTNCHYGGNKWMTCSKMVVLKLKKGDKVQIVVHNGPGYLMKKNTSFSGYKL
ncbi:complement C1q-like protein 4 [Saccostrea cucullata]|uniref:complement C1q-like protein 4 n=1 Tax=Saccostrea cuccullata TaxID=36930 RepID=UPI002ED194AC